MPNKAPASAAAAALARKEGPTIAIDNVRHHTEFSDHVPANETFHLRQGEANDLKNQGDDYPDQQVVTGQPSYPAL